MMPATVITIPSRVFRMIFSPKNIKLKTLFTRTLTMKQQETIPKLIFASEA
jgi:hypothetical protein